MKQYQKQQSKHLIKYNNQAPTAWETLIYLIGFAAIVTIYLFTSIKEHEMLILAEIAEASTSQEVQNQPVPREVRIVTTTQYEAEKTRQDWLDKLEICESEQNLYAIGDSGASVGPFQWQKPTFEEKIGKSVTYNEYYNFVTNYDKIRALTYEVFFEQDEWWRWENCSYKIGYKK